MDDCCPFKTVNIGTAEKIVNQELLSLPVGTSRTLGLSMIISPIYKIGKMLCVDQVVELCWVASFLNSPVRFNETLTRLLDSNSEIDEHPYYTWINSTFKIFDTWQGGTAPRYSCCGNQLVDIFGRDNANTDSRERLEKVSVILFEWIKFVDLYYGESDANDIPYLMIETKMTEICGKLRTATTKTGCKALDFKSFRLSIFTTLISALMIPKPGPHLHQFMLPCENTASFNHLRDPFMSNIDEDEAASLLYSMSTDAEQTDKMNEGQIPPEDFDSFMRELSSTMNWESYKRNQVENHLCEAHPCRSLNKVELYKKKENIHDLNETGTGVMKKYGSLKQWIPIEPPNRDLKFKQI